MKKTKMRLAFITGFESNAYAGPLRPFVNWAKYLSKDFDIIVLLYRSSPKILEGLHEGIRNLIKFCDSINLLQEELNKFNPNIIFGDGGYRRLKLYSKLNTKSKIVIYAQILFCLHAISSVFSYENLPIRDKVRYKISSAIPFKILIKDYIRLIRQSYFIISNSVSTKNYFKGPYGLNSNKVIFPPVDTKIFMPGFKKRNKILLYLGSSGGDVSLTLIQRILKILTDRNYKVNIIGNSSILSSIKHKSKNLDCYINISDVELARLYSESILTILPQNWELFGYSAVESMACGTPVLAFNYFGHAETIVNGKTGWLANDDKDFLFRLAYKIQNKPNLSSTQIRKYIINNYSIKKSSEELKKLIIKLV